MFYVMLCIEFLGSSLDVLSSTSKEEPRNSIRLMEIPEIPCINKVILWDLIVEDRQ